MALSIPRFDIQQHEIDVSKLFIRQPFTQTSIRIERRVNSHSLRRAQESHDETVLHERLAAAQRKTSRHDLQTVTILAEAAIARSSGIAIPFIMFHVSGL